MSTRGAVAQVGEPVWIAKERFTKAPLGQPETCVILTAISSDRATLTAFGLPKYVKPRSIFHLYIDLPDTRACDIRVAVEHLAHRESVQTLEVRMLGINKRLKARLTKLLADYADCEARLKLSAQSPCTGETCTYFKLCKKPQRSV